MDLKEVATVKQSPGVETDKGTIECEQVVIGAGPWARDFWNMLELPKTANIKGKMVKCTKLICGHIGCFKKV
jgi:glycine/D-amino acid oxidase-like deaminating enzyme